MDLEAQAAQRVGTTLCNKWTLERLIGTGGMAAVYVAAHKIGRREAIKILHPEVAKDPDLRARFEQEAQTVNRFKHPGAVEVRDIDVAEDGSPFLVMELLEGRPLADLARAEGGVPLGPLLGWVDELLDVLAAAHAQGIIHRDIKPDNLFVQSDGRLKVLDFGIARVRAGVSSKPRTRAGATLGTAPYMPPEQIRGAEIDGRADLFAVGATMFRLIAHRRIHEAPSEAEMLLLMARLPAPPLASVAPHAPPDVCLVVDRALMFDRERRYPDALTMQRDVRAVREGRPPPYATDRAGVDPTAPGTKPGPGRASPPGAAGGEPTAPAAKVGGASVATMAASPVALHAPGEGHAPPPESSLELPLPPRSSQREDDPRAERTLRSEAGPEADGAAVEPQGYNVATTVMPEAAPHTGRGKGPRTQQSGVAVQEPAPGESIPVIEAPPPPTRRRTLPGTEVSLWPLVIVGVVFAALGVSITLYFMLQGAPDAPVPVAPAERREPAHPAPRPPAPHDPHSPGLAPQHGPPRVQQR